MCRLKSHIGNRTKTLSRQYIYMTVWHYNAIIMCAITSQMRWRRRCTRDNKFAIDPRQWELWSCGGGSGAATTASMMITPFTCHASRHRSRYNLSQCTSINAAIERGSGRHKHHKSILNFNYTQQKQLFFFSLSPYQHQIHNLA